MSRDPLPAPIREALEATGKPWSLEQGGKHLKLRLDGRLIGVISRSGKQAMSGTNRMTKNMVADIRRLGREGV